MNDIWGYDVRGRTGRSAFPGPRSVRLEATDDLPEMTVELLPSDLEWDPLPFGSGEVAVVTCWEVIEHLGHDPMNLLVQDQPCARRRRHPPPHDTEPGVGRWCPRDPRRPIAGALVAFPSSGTDDRHNREYTPEDLGSTRPDMAGLSNDAITTVTVWDDPGEMVLSDIAAADPDTPGRGDCIIAVCRKVGSAGRAVSCRLLQLMPARPLVEGEVAIDSWREAAFNLVILAAPVAAHPRAACCVYSVPTWRHRHRCRVGCACWERGDQAGGGQRHRRRHVARRAGWPDRRPAFGRRGHCMVFTVDHDLRRADFDSRFGPVWIGDRVFIGSMVLVLPGVRIGNGAAVGGGSVVAADVPDGVIVAGNPAVPVGERPTGELTYTLDPVPWLR